MSKRIVIKIGSNVLSREDGTLDGRRIFSIVGQIARLKESGLDVIIVSSGAVAAGRGEIRTSHELDTVSSRQLYSAVGQVKLINRYYELFHELGIICGQVLTTKESLSLEDHYLNQKNCMETMLAEGVIPIINENDTISITELMFTDNDELSGLISTMMGVDLLVILTNVDGIFTGDPSDPASKLIPVIQPDEETDLEGNIVTEHSSFGRGGMLTKCKIARKMAAEGVEVIIANGMKENILLDVLTGAGILKAAAPLSDAVCTRFIPAAKPATK